MKARIKFRKYGVMKFIGHLDVMRFFQKAMRRADIPIAFTGGYSPHMIMSFAQPLGVGVTSDGEYLDIELKEPITSEDAVNQLNQVMVEGIDVVSFREIPDDKKCSGMTIVAAAKYQVTLQESFKTSDAIKRIPDLWQEKVVNFMNQPEIVVLKRTKRSEKEMDIKPMIYQMETDKDGIHLFLATGSEQNLKPDLVMETFLNYIGEKPEEVPLHYHRLEVYARKPETPATMLRNQGEKATADIGEQFVSLEELGEVVR
ncbi:TIGR03936 family radical SAM-associated protein [Bariatricus sp. SGI.154]|uniref:TIGR03936 family radical SAM-associated protein n=1 Tax=Bariatricus sp. SGI.154 TaxID=3420549 RepID=UPI003CFDE095